MDSARLRSLHSALATLLLPLLVGLGAAGGLLVWNQWDFRQGAVRARAHDAAEHLALLLQRELAVETGVVEALAQSPLIDRGDWAAFHSLASRIAARRPGALIAVTDSAGQLLVNTSVPFGSELPNVYELEREQRHAVWKGQRLPLGSGGLTRRARETRKPVYSNLYYGVATGQPSLAVAIPVEREAGVVYTLTYAFSAESLARFMAARNPLPEGLAQVIDGEGRVVASSRAHDEFLARPVPASLINAAHARVAEGVRYPDSSTHLVARADTTPGGWNLVLSIPTGVAYASSYRALALSLAILAGVMALAAWLVLRHSRALSAPLLQLAARVRDPTRASAPASDIREIAILAEAVRTAESAHEREREEQVRRRLAEERESHTRALAQELRAADRRKNAFLATLGHELRNPLAPMLNAVHLLQPVGERAAETAKLKAIMMRQLQHLGCLVEDLLDVTRIAEGKIELRPRRTDLVELAQRIADDYEPLMKEAGIALGRDWPAERVHAMVDPTRITQMVANLLQNAMRFTPRGGTIGLSIGTQGGRARITVRDSGAGFESASLDRLFEPFVQGDQPAGRNDGGLGLGLAIVKGLAELHGGRVHATSAGPGRGAEFTIELPAAE